MTPRGRLRLIGGGGGHDSAALIDTWETWQRGEGLAERTAHERGQLVLRAAARGGTTITDMTPVAITRALADLTPGTRQAYFSGLRAWHRWLVLTGIRPDDPTVFVKPRPAPRGTPRPIDTAHLERMLQIRMHRRTRTMVLLLAYQGLRVSEAARIRGEDVDVVGQRLRVTGKGGVTSVVPLHPIIAGEAARYPRSEWWFPSHTGNRRGPARRGPILGRSLSEIVAGVMRRAGVPGTPHALRHWFGSELGELEVDSRVIQILMRHASLSTTQIYVRVSMRQQREALARLPTFDQDMTKERHPPD